MKCAALKSPNISIFECYKQTLRDKWTLDGLRAKWTNRLPPEWKDN